MSSQAAYLRAEALSADALVGRHINIDQLGSGRVVSKHPARMGMGATKPTWP